MNYSNNKNQWHEMIVGEGKEARKIALIHRASQSRTDEPVGLVWLGGFRSDMEGSKAAALDSYAADCGIACTRHDYSGHGRSGGAFMDGTISRWLEESLAVFYNYTTGPQIIVGSSMGGWIALRMMQELQKVNKMNRVRGLLLLAPAPDFTRELIEPELDKAHQKALEQDGYFEVPTPYSSVPNIFTKKLFDDGHHNLVLDGMLQIGVPVHIIQGMQDADVPWQHAVRLVEHLSHEDVVLTLVKDGDHRLSRESDIARMLQTVEVLKKQNL